MWGNNGFEVFSRIGIAIDQDIRDRIKSYEETWWWPYLSDRCEFIQIDGDMTRESVIRLIEKIIIRYAKPIRNKQHNGRLLGHED